MTREQELNEVKEIIKENIEDANCGIFNSRNLAGDTMEVIFKGEYFTLEICKYWEYFEIFGTTENEWHELEEYYYQNTSEIVMNIWKGMIKND